MWCCYDSRSPKNNRYLAFDGKNLVAATRPVENPLPDEVQVNVAYVCLTILDKERISNRKSVGFYFSGHIKAIGKAGEDSPFKIDDKVYGVIDREDVGAITEFLNVKLSSIFKIPAEVSLEAGASIPIVEKTVTHLRPLLKENTSVWHSGVIRGFYQSIFDIVALQNKASQNSVMNTSFLFLTERNNLKVPTTPDTEVWSIIPGYYENLGDQVNQFDAFPSQPTAIVGIDKFALEPKNLDILIRIRFNESELPKTKEEFEKTLSDIESGKRRGPIVVNVDVLRRLPKKKEIE